MSQAFSSFNRFTERIKKAGFRKPILRLSETFVILLGPGFKTNYKSKTGHKAVKSSLSLVNTEHDETINGQDKKKRQARL